MGDRVACGSFACMSGVCKRSCTTTNECVSGTECQGYVCAKPVQQADGSYYYSVTGTSLQPRGLQFKETITADGNPGDTCLRGVCYTQVASRCSDDRKFTIEYGVSRSCGRYHCEPASGKCLTECYNQDECSGSCNTVTHTCN